MTYVVAAPCIADYSCVEVCPVDCIHPMPDEIEFATATQLYIDPTACVDCGACEEACPVNAIFAGDRLPAKWTHYARINADHFRVLAQGESHG